MHTLTAPSPFPLARSAYRETPHWPVGSLRQQVENVIATRRLTPLFQPIVDMRLHAYIGFEALIRGPADSPLRMPHDLFTAARDAGLVGVLEEACREVSLRAFASLGLPGRLFLNITPGQLLEPAMRDGALLRLMREVGLAPGNVVFELTENQQITDLPEIQQTLADYRAQGFVFAIDDLGEGFSNLRMWSEVRPEFVKIDRHFIHGVADDKIKYQFVRAMQDIAEISSAQIVAEGIERESDFACVRDLGIACGQGYFIAVPEPNPRPAPSTRVMGALRRSQVTLSPHATPGRAPTAEALSRYLHPVSPNASNEHVIGRFEMAPETDVLPVVENGVPVGLISRGAIIDRFARPFRKELYGRRHCTLFMDHSPLIVDKNVGVQELGLTLSRAAKRYLLDGFIVTCEGKYHGVGSSHELMAMITEMQISAARYANPLTQLPGNVPINEHIDLLLGVGAEFVACYLDIDNFKPYNDTYGYRRGDDVIQILGSLLRQWGDARQDFIGHVGGDDFIVLYQSPDWEARCQRLIREFRLAMGGLVDPEDQERGGYYAENRKGESVFCPLPSLSIGALKVEPQRYESHREVAAAASVAKKEAKKKGGGALFIERRGGRG